MAILPESSAPLKVAHRYLCFFQGSVGLLSVLKTHKILKYSGLSHSELFYVLYGTYKTFGNCLTFQRFVITILNPVFIFVYTVLQKINLSFETY